MKSMFFCIALLSFPLHAETLTDRIHSLVESSPESSIVRFEKGRVGFLSKAETESLNNKEGAMVEVELDESNQIRQLVFLQAPVRSENGITLKNTLFDNPPVFETTVVSSSQMQDIYRRMNPNFKRLSECSDRAHVWAFEEFQKTGVKSQKAFIFFTASYIDRVRFKWWFHVAPMFDVQTGNGIQKMVTDVMYKERPVTLKEWSNMMVFSRRDCKMTTKFSEYDVNPQTEDCYMIFESMYYRLPGEIHDQEIRGVYRSEWNETEVNGARSRAFHFGRIQ